MVGCPGQRPGAVVVCGCCVDAWHHCRWVMRLGNIATLSREWAAVKRVEMSPLRELLLQGSAIGLPPGAARQVPAALLEYLRRHYNDSQFQAMTIGLDGRPLVLIQGPPGTGKTQCVPPCLRVQSQAQCAPEYVCCSPSLFKLAVIRSSSHQRSLAHTCQP
jgi:AAA domain